jgi:glucose/arabinose dehydrogenase
MRAFPALAPTLALAVVSAVPTAAPPAPPATCTRATGLNLPEGFCAIVVADHLGRVRQLTVLPNGDVLAALNGSGGVIALRDADGDGRADTRKSFGDEGGTGIGYHDGAVWFAPNDRVLRWRWTLGDLSPAGDPEVVVEGLPTNGHSMKSFAFLGGDTLIVSIGSETNSCQRSDRSNRSPGRDPCDELTSRAGLWRFSTTRLHQRQKDGERFATGLRNPEALAVDPATGKLFAAPHGRDQLGQNWGFSDAQNAELPAEEFMQVEPGDDFGWPYCYWDWQQSRNVLAPEYGGNGSTIGRCDTKKHPLIGFPGHWAPMAITFYHATQFPAKYRGGAFISFHGSWNRAPLPQQGYRVVFVPFGEGENPTGSYQTFATSSRGETALRPVGLAVGPDGSLYIGDEASGTIWRVMAQDAGQ